MVRKLTLAALAVALATPAFAAGVDTGPAPRNEPLKRPGGAAVTAQAATAKQLKGFGGAAATYARVALVFDFEASVLRSKGVAQVRNPSAGLYCILPTSLDSTAVNKAVPVVSPDYALSSGVALSATVYSGVNCKSTEFGVQTLRGDSGKFLKSDFVGFDFIVP